MTDKWRQRPVWCTDGEHSSGLYIARSSLHTCHRCQLLTERVCRLLLPSPTLTKELDLKRSHELWTTKAMDRLYLPGLGKASMLQTSHPRLHFLGWGWFKGFRLKAPGSPAENLFQPGTAGQTLLQQIALHRSVTAGHKQHCHGMFRWIMLYVSLQPFEHRSCDAQPCLFLRVALSCSPDVAPCGRASGTPCTLFPSLGDVECSL
eukprot:1536375-Amphidinium_carterae.1